MLLRVGFNILSRYYDTNDVIFTCQTGITVFARAEWSQQSDCAEAVHIFSRAVYSSWDSDGAEAVYFKELNVVNIVIVQKLHIFGNFISLAVGTVIKQTRFN